MALRRRESIMVNGCVLVATDGGRCDRWFSCPYELARECLNATAARNFSGWRREDGNAKGTGSDKP